MDGACKENFSAVHDCLTYLYHTPTESGDARMACALSQSSACRVPPSRAGRIGER